MNQVLISFGSNLGEPVQTCRGAIEALERHPQIALLKVSSFYRTEPVGMIEQDWFINGVVLCETSLEPDGLLEVIDQIEKEFGRVREIHWGPRTLDLDILAFGDLQVESPDLTIPHPRLHERRFVLLPLSEIAPLWVHPVLKLEVGEMLDRLCDHNDQKVERLELL